MNNTRVGEKYFLKFSKLTEAGVFHFTSTKQGWGKDGKSRFTGDSPELFHTYRQELALALKMDTAQFVFPRQVHGDRVEVVRNPAGPDIPATDALVTNVPGICVCVQTADCVPVLLFDPVQKVVAAVHAGWRGTVSKIVAKTIHCMQLYFDSEPEDLWAGIGPSIHSHVYEVGNEVIDQVRSNFDNHRSLLIPSVNDNKACFDLWEANRQIMISAGLHEERIEVMGYCSYSHDSLFYSARRDGPDTGRMVTGIMLASEYTF